MRENTLKCEARFRRSAAADAARRCDGVKVIVPVRVVVFESEAARREASTPAGLSAGIQLHIGLAVVGSQDVLGAWTALGSAVGGAKEETASDDRKAVGSGAGGVDQR